MSTETHRIPFVAPEAGKAVLLHNVFSTEQTSAILADFTGPNNPIPYNKADPKRRPRHLNDVCEDLETKGLLAALNCVETLGDLAVGRDKKINHIVFDRQVPSEGIPPHRDTVPPSISFVLVASGEVTYRLHGQLGHIDSSGNNYRGYEINKAVAGDVLCINNMIPKWHLGKRALHQSLDGKGARFPMDFRRTPLSLID